MKKPLFRELIARMMPELIEGIEKECDKLYACGGVDPESYEDNYLLPKIILTVAIENQVHQYMPLNEADKKVVRNLRHF